MNRQIWATVNKMSPVDLRLVLYGVVCGPLICSLRLGESTEEATALGIAVFVQTTFGIWLGLKPCRFWIHIAENRLNSLTGRLDALISRLNLINRPAEDKYSGRSSSIWSVIVRSCIYITPFGMVSITVGAVSAAIDFRVNLYVYDLYFLEIIGGSLLVFLCVAIQYVDLWLTGRRLTRLEQYVDLGDPITKFALSNDQFGSAFSNMESFVYKVTGQRLAT